MILLVHAAHRGPVNAFISLVGKSRDRVTLERTDVGCRKMGAIELGEIWR